MEGDIPTPAELTAWRKRFIQSHIDNGHGERGSCSYELCETEPCQSTRRLLAAVEALQEDLAADQAHFRECASGVLLETARREREALRAQVEALQTYHVVNNQGAR